MKHRALIPYAVGLLVLAVSLSAVSTAYAENRVQRYVIAGGGGESAGGNFRVHGTIGQPAVAMLSGGGFTLRGGFWYGEGEPVVLHPLYLPLLLKQ
jgi:hypothetical protein